MVISPEQCRAARAWLDWTQDQLAAAAGVSQSTVRDFEKGRRVPVPASASALIVALEKAGIVLVHRPDGSPKGIERRQA